VDRQVVNPWAWQDQFGFVQGNKVTGADQILFCAGQTSVDGEGRPVHPGDMVAQINTALDNLEAVLAGGGMTLSNVVRLNYYTTDLDSFFGAAEQLGERLAAGGCRPASTLFNVVRLASPELMVEMEATAVS
jgi:enamine deaminase RidA (YjgF/YER057c/UK114 family)